MNAIKIIGKLFTNDLPIIHMAFIWTITAIRKNFNAYIYIFADMTFSLNAKDCKMHFFTLTFYQSQEQLLKQPYHSAFF